MNSRKVARETISSKKNKGPQRMSRDASSPPVSKTVSTPAPFSSQELREINIQISASWFRAPEATHLTLMEVHPRQLHAYWNIAAADMAAARASLPTDAEEPSLILRFIDLSAQRGENIPAQRFDIEVQGLTNSWYVDLWQDGRRYSAQLGLRTAEGDMIPLASSNEVALPRAAPSSELDFKQLEVHAPLPLELNVPETVSDHGEHLLQNLFPRRRPLDEGFPEYAPEVLDIKLDEPECPALMPMADALADSPAPFKSELELIDYAHASRSPAFVEDTEFPQIEISEVTPYSIRAKKEEARLLAEIERELPPLAKVTISPADGDLTPQPLPLFRREPELPQSTLPSEPLPSESALESSIQAGGLDLAEAQPQEPGAMPDLLQGGFPEVMPDRDTGFVELEFPVSIVETGVGQGGPVPLVFQDKVTLAVNTPQAHRSMAEEATAKQSSSLSGPAPHPVIALEEVLGKADFSNGRGESELEVTAELHLHGKLGPGRVLSLLGEQVHFDAHGNFSVRLMLDRGPALSALLYGQRKRPEESR
jgi:hypothetical protein